MKKLNDGTQYVQGPAYRKGQNIKSNQYFVWLHGRDNEPLVYSRRDFWDLQKQAQRR